MEHTKFGVTRVRRGVTGQTGEELVESDGGGDHDVPLWFEVTPTAGAREGTSGRRSPRGGHRILG